MIPVINKKSVISLLKNKTFRNGGLFSIFSFFNKGISFLLLMILAKYIAPDQYGYLSLFNTVVTFLGFTAGLSTAGYLGVSFFKNKLSDFKIDLTTIILITVTSSIVLFLIIIVLNEWLSNLLKLNDRLLIIALFISFSSIIMGLLLDYFRVREQVLKYGLISCGYALINFIVTLYLIIYKNFGWIGFVYSLSICNLVYSLGTLLFFTIKKLLIIPKNWSKVKNILLWGIPLIPHSATTWIKQGLDRYIIDSNYSISEVGIFSFALNLTNIIVMIGVAFNQTNSVNIFKSLSATDTNKKMIVRILQKKEKYYLAIYAIIAVIVAAGVSILIPILLTNYQSSLSFFYLLSIFGIAQCYYLVYCNYLFYFNRTVDLMYITFGIALLHFILSLLFTKYSLMYTCMIYIILQAVTTILVFLRSRKLLNIYINEESI